MSDREGWPETSGEIEPALDSAGSPLVFDRRITYDSSDAGLQWRCHVHLLKKEVLCLAILPVLLIIVEKPLLFIIGITVMGLGITLLPVAIAVYFRTRGSRICTTAVTEIGLNDVTPDSSKTLVWRQIKAVEMTAGDIYFLTGRGGGVFVPRTAFGDQGAANDFYKHAKLLWERDRAQGSLAKIDHDQVTKQLIETLNSEEEAVWQALEQQHASLNAKQTASEPDDLSKDKFQAQ